MIGITNAGEPTIDRSWLTKLDDESIDQFIITTKNPGAFCYSEIGELIMDYTDKITIAGSISGFSKTRVEAETITYTSAIISLKGLYDAGVKINLVLSPVFPTANGVKSVKDILAFAAQVFGDELVNVPIKYQVVTKNEFNEARGLEFPDNPDLLHEIVDYIVDFGTATNCSVTYAIDPEDSIELLEDRPCPMNCLYCYKENKFEDEEL